MTLLLGAGASRGVSYARERENPSPLDRDFFDLLQRLEPRKRDEPAVKFVLDAVKSLPYQYRLSMERAFYTLHLRSYMDRKLTLPATNDRSAEERVVAAFARCIQALLRSAHAKKICRNHEQLVQSFRSGDTIISFNYDLVVERALSEIALRRGAPFGGWLYGFSKGPKKFDLPMILKLHGSSNWRLVKDDFVVLTKTWDEFHRAPGYLGHKGHGTIFPIFLPFWDKRIERRPWLQLWQHAMKRLRSSGSLVVWGFSLAQTDVKAQQLLNLALGKRRGLRLCVVDPSAATRERWREMLPEAQYWEYTDIHDFLKQSPRWWQRTSGV